MSLANLFRTAARQHLASTASRFCAIGAKHPGSRRTTLRVRKSTSAKTFGSCTVQNSESIPRGTAATSIPSESSFFRHSVIRHTNFQPAILRCTRVPNLASQGGFRAAGIRGSLPRISSHKSTAVAERQTSYCCHPKNYQQDKTLGNMGLQVASASISDTVAKAYSSMTRACGAPIMTLSRAISEENRESCLTISGIRVPTPFRARSASANSFRCAYM